MREPYSSNDLHAREMYGPRQPDPGTQLDRYRCSLPGLTGFTASCRGGTDADHGYFTIPLEKLGARDAGGCVLRCRPRTRGATGWMDSGEVAERLKAHAWKVCIRPKGVSRVRIPPSPPIRLGHDARGSTLSRKRRRRSSGPRAAFDLGFVRVI